MSRTHKFLHTVSATALSLAIAAPALAQNVLTTDVITVTAQKREQNIIDVPIAVTVYNQDQLDALGAQQFDDIADFIPGLEVQEQSANNPGFVIRGITSDDGAANIEPRVSIYQDGVSIARSRGSFVEVFDSSIEVIRGPQPTLFGRSALIGAINLTSNRPDLSEFSGNARLGAGNYDFNFAEGMVNVPLIQDELAVRGAFRYKSRDGYVENILDGDDFNSFDMFAGRLSVTYAPTDYLEFTLIGNYQSDDNSGTSFKSGTFLPEPDGSIKPGAPAALSTFGPLQGGRDLGLEREVKSLTGLVDYAITDNLTLTSISNYREFDSSEVFDPDGFAYEVFAFAENAESEQFSQELRLDFENFNGFSGFIGASYFKEDGFQNVPLAYTQGLAAALQFELIFTDAITNVQNPAPISLLPDIGYFEEAFTNFGETTAYDLFADATYAVTDRLEVTAGVRYTRDEKTVGFTAEADGVSFLGNGLNLGDAIFADGAVVEREEDFDAVTWRAAANYDLTDDVTIFANYARGRRPEVIDYDLGRLASDEVLLSDNTLNPEGFILIDAEEVDAYEIGAKGTFFDGRIYADASFYYYDYTNFQSDITQLDEEGNLEFLTVNAGNATAYGFESVISGELTDWLNGFITYAWTDATFDDEDDAGNPLAFAGNRFRLTPEHSFSVGATFSKTFDCGTYSFSPIYAWKSEVFFDENNDLEDAAQNELQDAFGVLDLRFNYTTPDGRYGLEVFMENALDEEYIIDAGNTGDSFGIPTFIAGPPQTFGVYGSVRF